MKRRGRWIAALVAFAAAFPALTPAAGPGVGSAETSSSLISVGVSRTESDVETNVQSVDVMSGVGSATNDPAENSVHLADVVLALARADGATQIDSAPFDVSARAKGPGTSSENNTDLAVGLNFGETLNADVTVASVDASVDPDSASASLSQVNSDASIMSGLASLSGVTIVRLSAESTPEAAESSQTVGVDHAYLFNLQKLLDQFGLYFSDLSNGDLAGLAERLLGPNASDELEEAVAALEAILAEADDLHVAVGLLEDGVPDLSDIDAMATIYELANEYGVDPSYCPFPPDPFNPCDVFQMALETAGRVEDAIEQAKPDAEEAVKEARSDLEGYLSNLPLLTLNDVSVSVAAHAETGNSSATSTISWGSAEVAGQLVPFADLQDAAQNLGDALADALSALGGAFGMEFGLSLSFPAPSDETGTQGDYETASADVTAFSMAISAISRSGSQTTAEVSLLSMSATAEHKTTEVSEATELVITKTDGVTSVVAGDGKTHTYTITVTNTGGSDAENVMISDTFPAGFTRGALPDGCTDSGPDNDDFTCSLGTIAAGGNASVTIPYTVPSGTPAGTYTNTVVIASTHPGDDSSDNSASDTNTITEDEVEDTELAITKTDGVTSVIAGDGATHTYTITVTNAGPSDAQNVMISDTFPAGFTRGALPAECTDSGPDNDDFTCAMGTIAAGGSASVSIPYTVPSGTPAGTYTNTVVIASAHPGDDSSDNSASDTNTITEDEVENTELVITKTDGVTSVIAGDGVTYNYTITVTNTGGSDAENVMISDTFPAGFTRGVLPAECTDSGPDNDDFTCAMGTIAAGGSASVSIPYTVPSGTPAGTYTNTVVIASAHPGDDPSDNSASDVNTINEDESDVLGDNQNLDNNPGSDQNPQANQPGNPNNQGAPPPGEGTPTSSPTLPRTGADTDRLLLLGCQLILLGWALERRAIRGSGAEAKG